MEIFDIQIDITFLLAITGALLSIILTGLRIKEYWDNKFKIEIDPIIRSAAEYGHDISIKNLSSKPVLLEYMEIYTKEEEEERCVWSPEDMFLNDRIEPLDAKVYHFSGAHYFRWKHNNTYIHLHFAGRKPIVKKI